MAAIRLANYNIKRLLRRKALRTALLVVPIAVALLRIVFTRNDMIHYAAMLCPLVCALMISAVLYAQWSVDAASGLLPGLRSCPVGPRTVAASRIISGAWILVAQMILFVVILLIRL